MLCSKMYYLLLGIVLFSLGSNAAGLRNESEIEALCVDCATANKTFLKFVFVTWSNPIWVCRDVPRVMSKFGMIADYAMDNNSCRGIYNRPVTTVSERDRLFIGEGDVKPNDTDCHIVLFLSCLSFISLVVFIIGSMLPNIQGNLKVGRRSRVVAVNDVVV